VNNKENTVLRKKAIDYLSRREHSRWELKQKLIAKNFSDFSNADDADIEKILDQLIQDNLQSDVRFAESYVRYRKQAGFGPNRIKLELRERGVASVLIDDVLDVHASEWQTQMKNVWQKKFLNPSKNQAEKAAQFRFLLYRGYTSEAIKALLFSNLTSTSIR